MPVVRLAIGACVSPMNRLRIRTLGRYFSVSSTVIALTVSSTFLAVTLSVVTGRLFRSATERVPSTWTAGKVDSDVCENADEARQAKAAATTGRRVAGTVGNVFMQIPCVLWFVRHRFRPGKRQYLE